MNSKPTESNSVEKDIIYDDIKSYCENPPGDLYTPPYGHFKHPISFRNSIDESYPKQNTYCKFDDNRPVNLIRNRLDRICLDWLIKSSVWVKANPNDKTAVEELNATYNPIKKEYKNNVANYFKENEDNTLISYLETQLPPISKEFNKNILLKGSRGVGKTSFINYLLNNRTSAWAKDQIAWFRIDVTKVREIWRLFDKNPNLTLEGVFKDYYLLHSIYVILLHGGKLRELKPEHFSNASDNSYSYSEHLKTIADFLYDKNPDHIEQISTEFCDIMGTSNITTNTDISVQIIHEYFKRGYESQRAKRFDVLSKLANCIKISEEHKELCVISIIDGLDNISWTHRNKFYSDSTSCFVGFMNAIRDIFSSKYISILAARPETITQIRSSIAKKTYPSENSGHTFSWTQDDADLITLSVEPPLFQDAISAKIDFSVNEKKINAYIRSLRTYSSASDKRVKELTTSVGVRINQIKQVSEKYTEQLLKQIENKLSNYKFATHGQPHFEDNLVRRINDNQVNIIKLLFDNDTRAFILTFYRVALLSTYLLTYKKATQSQLNQRILSYTILDGNPFWDSTRYFELPDRETEPRTRANVSRTEAAVFQNPFWFQDTLNDNLKNTYLGLCAFRILQIFEVKGRSNIVDVAYIANKIFDYRIDVIEECIETFIATGVLDTDPEATNQSAHWQFLQEKSADDDKFSEFLDRYQYDNASLQDKGKLLFRIMFIEPSILYAYAIDDLSPQKSTMTLMRFPINLRIRRSQYEEKTFYRRTNYRGHQRA